MSTHADNYHSDHSAVSKTALKLFMDSRVEYMHTYVTGKMPPKIQTEPQLKGIVRHCLALEGASVDDLVLTYPPECLNVNGGLIGKRAAAFRAEHAGAVIVKPDERAELVALTTSVLQTEAMQQFIGAHAIVEERFDATVEGVLCKCKPDILREYDDRVIIYDLKFPTKLTRDSFERSNKSFAYWLQDAHYTAIIEQVFEKPVEFVFLNIESSFPFRVIPRRLERQVTRPTAKAEHRKLLRALRECMDSGEWEDDWGGELVMSPWDFKTADDLVVVEA